MLIIRLTAGTDAAGVVQHRAGNRRLGNRAGRNRRGRIGANHQPIFDVISFKFDTDRRIVLAYFQRHIDGIAFVAAGIGQRQIA